MSTAGGSASLQASGLQAGAEQLGQALPALLAEAEMLAATVTFGEHGRRRSGQGDEFWQYRAALPGDSARLIDWRRSARSDGHFLREQEWQAAQSVSLWVDPSRSMGFSGAKARGTKAERARLLALALAVLLLRGGERVGLSGLPGAEETARPRAGRGQILRLAMRLSAAPEEGDYGRAVVEGITAHGRVVLISDFLGPLEAVEAAIARASDRGARGVILQILDPAEEDFPFDGRTIFESMGGSLRHETLRAGELRTRYLARLAERKDRLSGLSRASGWQFQTHHTGSSAQSALLWLYRALEGGR